MFVGIYLLVIIFENMKYLSFFFFSFLYFSQVKWKPTLLLTRLFISFLYSKMRNFNFISCCKGIVLFQSHLCNSIVIVRNKLC